MTVTGGLDSLLLMLTQHADEYVYINYGQKYKKYELDVLDKVLDGYTVLELKDKIKIADSGFFEARNFKILHKIRETYLNDDLLVYFGTNAEDVFPDNSPLFMSNLEYVFNNSYNRKMRIVQPLKDMDKREISDRLETIMSERDIKVYPRWCLSEQKDACGDCKSCKTMKYNNIYEKWVK